jgi:hypothetical protein
MSVAALVPLILKLSIMLSVFALGLKATFADALYMFRCSALRPELTALSISRRTQRLNQFPAS